MKKPTAAIAATMLSLALAVPAWAGGSAIVDQAGDGNYTLLVQSRNGTKVTTAPVGSPQHYQAIQREKMVVTNALRPQPPRGVRSGGRVANSCADVPNTYVQRAPVSRFASAANNAGVVQVGANNTAIAAQNGANNSSRIIQRGNDHYAETNQTGNDNSAVIVQRC
ncbi:MAG: hypothetical protein KF765_06865 [Parvibaculaceae bacterium]|nr:hypothetical protein [Parvibaculaceae bacterium]